MTNHCKGSLLAGAQTLHPAVQRCHWIPHSSQGNRLRIIHQGGQKTPMGVLELNWISWQRDTFAPGTGVNQALHTGSAESNFRALSVGEASRWLSTICSSCSLAPQCSLHLIFQKHQQIRKEAPWNCSLDERDICRPAAEVRGVDVFASHSLILQPTLANNTHTCRGECWQCGRLQLSTQALAKESGSQGRC